MKKAALFGLWQRTCAPSCCAIQCGQTPQRIHAGHSYTYSPRRRRRTPPLLAALGVQVLLALEAVLLPSAFVA